MVTWLKMTKFSKNAISQLSLFIVCVRPNTHTDMHTLASFGL